MRTPGNVHGQDGAGPNHSAPTSPSPHRSTVKGERAPADTSRMRRVRSSLLVLLVSAGALLLPAQSAFADFTDVPKDHWAYDAVQYVAVDNTWMQDYGTDEFKPDDKELRKYLARTLVEIYAPDEPIDPTITFPDLATDDPFYPYANVVVKLDWIKKLNGGLFKPDGKIKSRKFDRALIYAMGLKDVNDDLNDIHQADGTAYDVP
jgi:hypothetical protein